MQKSNISPLQEILDVHFNQGQDYLEEALSVFMNDFMQVSSGVISGLEVTYVSGALLNVATGHIFQDSVFGTLESVSGLTCSLPVSGTRTDLIVGSYLEVEDTIASGYVLMDVSSSVETIEELASRRFGAVIIEQLADTTYATMPGGYVPLCEITLSSSAVTGTSDVRVYSRIQRLQEDFRQNYISMFYAGF